MPVLYAVSALIGLLVAVILIRAATFQPKKQRPVSQESVSFDKDAAVSALSQLIQCKTISHNDPSAEEDGEFQKLISLLPSLYPRVFEACSFLQLPDRALLFRWRGKNSNEPTVLMAHYDVVPVDASKWDKPPFSGLVEDGVMWGRGTLDTKVTFNGILSGAEQLICQGFQPDRDIYFAFSGGEEVNGPGAGNIVKYFQENHIQPALVVDEGGAVVENVFPGVKDPCGLIGIAEKGMMNVEYCVKSGGGHASAPPVKTPLTTLSQACISIIRHPFKMHLTKPAAEMFDTLGRHSNFGLKIVFANLWLFRPVLDLICKKSGGEMNALVRTTTAFTQAGGSDARNVIPTEATFVSNMRLNPADTVASATEYLKKVINDDTVEIRVLEANEPSRISVTDCDAWNKVSDAVAETWRGCIVAPYLMVQCSDSRHWGVLSDRVYRFSAMDLTSEERKTIHGNNERIRLETLYRCVEFYIRLMKKC